MAKRKLTKLSQNVRTVLQALFEEAIQDGTIDLVYDEHPVTTVELTHGELELLASILLLELPPSLAER